MSTAFTHFLSSVSCLPNIILHAVFTMDLPASTGASEDDESKEISGTSTRPTHLCWIYILERDRDIVKNNSKNN